MYWNGTDYVTPPIHIQAVCSTDQVNYKNEDVWLTTVLEEMKAATGNNTVEIERVRVNNQLMKDRMDSVSESVLEDKRSIANLVTATSENAIGIQNLEAENVRQNSEISRINQNVEAVIHTVNDHESVINSLDAQVDNLTEATNDVTVKAQTLENRVTENSERIESMSMDIYHLYETSHIHDDSIATLKSDVTAAKNSVNGLSSRLNETDADIANIEGEISDLEGEVAGVITKANTNASSISALATRTANVENRVTAVERRATTLESSVATNKTNITNLTTKVNDNTSSIAGVKADLNKYLPLTGGSLTGDLDVNGVLRMNGSQAFYYNVGAKTMNIGTNNATVVNMAGAHTGGTMNINSAVMKTYSVVPRNSDSLLGNSTYRWKGIYSQSSVNVSSDERLKSDIKPIDKESLAAFINALEVVRYKYIGCDEKRIGLIAQKVIEADPKLAKFFVNQSSDGYYNLKPADFVFPLIAAVQELKREIEELKK